VLDALGEAASKLRTELGESLATVQKFDVPLELATTSSLEPLQAYSLGVKAANEKGTATALPYHQRAIELDPNFATGYAAVGNDYKNLGRARAGQRLLHQGSAVAGTCQRAKILDHSGMVWNFWTERWRIWEWRVQTPWRRDFAGCGCRCRPRSGARRLQGFLRPLERRRPGHPHPEASQSGVRQIAVSAFKLQGWRFC
jgi:hypothetical protein